MIGRGPQHGQLDLFTAPAPAAPATLRKPASGQTRAHTCLECGHTGTDVLFGSCRDCFNTWRAAA